jgi:hypothetical protein
MPILRRKSILGTCLFLEKDYFEERPNCGKEDLMLLQATGGKKATCKKEGKAACKRKRNMVHIGRQA